MDNSGIIQVNMFGLCSISSGGLVIDSNSLHSKKIWMILAYLIFYRGRDVSQEALIDLIYSEDNSSNPLNALKTLMHRVRAVLDPLGHGGGKNILLQQSGSYHCNPALPLSLDVEIFEDLFNRSHVPEIEPGLALSLRLEAIKVYAGDFLPKFSMEPWVLPLATYYRTRYLQMVHEVISALAAEGVNNEIVEVCQKAIHIDPYDEALYYSLTLALVNLNQSQEALNQYEKTSQLFYKEFGVSPSEEFQSLYKKIVQGRQRVELSIDAVKDNLREDDADLGSFFCEYQFFKDIYRLEVRAAARTGKPVHICLITVKALDVTHTLSNKALNSAMDKLIDCTKATLRRGDIFARYSVSQLILLLPLTTMENAEGVLVRITKQFKAAHPRSSAELSYSFQAIDSLV